MPDDTRRHVQCWLFTNNIKKPKERDAVRVYDELVERGFDPRTIVADALVAYEGNTPQPTPIVQIDTDEIVRQVTAQVGVTISSQMQSLVDAVIALSARLKDVGLDFDMGEFADADDDDFNDLDYAIAIANSIKARNED